MYELPMIRTRGRAMKELEVGLVEELTQDDIGLLDIERDIKAPLLKRLTERHHELARCVAKGLKHWECASITGYGISRISILCSDPTFKELVTFYSDNVDMEFLDSQAQMAGLKKDAIIELRERLEDDPVAFSKTQLLEIITKMGDRTGDGPVTKSDVHVHIDVAKRLETARKRIADAKVIDGEILAEIV